MQQDNLDIGDLTRSLEERYRVEHLIGRGGMAAVYLAHDLKHQRRVALKVLNPDLTPSIGPRFLREIDVVARLTHPHIIPLFDSGQAGPFLYYVMPYIEGQSLRARLARETRLNVEEALRLTREVASALGHAHQQGVIHRDVKPENILLADGVALVADFGIAHAVAPAAAGATTAVATHAGALLGTPLYMSPEQVTGGEVDARSDVYALACVLYEMLAGEPPFAGRTSSEVMRQHLVTQAPPVGQRRTSVPAGVTAAVARALAKEPADRPSTMAKFADALTAAGSTPVAPAPAVAASLPVGRTRFIGREKELREGERLLADSRLLTVTGIGGSGKTRLAIELARRAAPVFPDGAAFVDLAPLTDASQVAETVAAQLSVRESPDQPVMDALAAQLGSKRCLLVIDNCEHVIGAASDLVDALLTACGGLTILATSREGLGIEGEHQMAVRSLTTPPETGGDDVETVGATEAVTLFVDRARAAASEFTLTSANAPAVAEICRRLDGIPLAIELAAARVRMLSVTQIRSMLDDRFRLLVVGGRKSVPRHQTLQATIQWSYDQLSPTEQRLFRMLSVFAGGWSLETAARLRGDAPGGLELVDDLGRLIDKSLVLVDRQTQEAPRYRFLETVRQYAQDRLSDAGESAEVHRRYADLFLDLAERAHAEQFERGDAWSDRLEVEHDNLRAAIEILRTSDVERHLELVGALAWFFHVRSYFREGRERLLRAVGAAAVEPPRPSRARALWGIAITLARQGNGVEALRWMHEALQLWRTVGNQREVVVVLEGIGWAEFANGEDEKACAAFQESLQAARALGDAHLVNQTMSAVAQVLVALHRVDEARALASEVVAFSSAHDDKRNEHSGWHYLADCALIEEHCQESLGLYRQSLVLARAIGDRLEITYEIQGVAMSLAGLDAPAQALRLAAACRAECERLGVSIHIRFWDALLDKYLGRARVALGPEEAERAWNDGIRLPFESAIVEALAVSPST